MPLPAVGMGRDTDVEDEAPAYNGHARATVMTRHRLDGSHSYG